MSEALEAMGRAASRAISLDLRRVPQPRDVLHAALVEAVGYAIPTSGRRACDELGAIGLAYVRHLDECAGATFEESEQATMGAQWKRLAPRCSVAVAFDVWLAMPRSQLASEHAQKALGAVLVALVETYGSEPLGLLVDALEGATN